MLARACEVMQNTLGFYTNQDEFDNIYVIQK